MPRVPVSPVSPTLIRCEHYGTVDVPLFTPPYDVAEFNNVTSNNWGFAYSTDLPYAASTAGVGFPGGISSILTAYKDAVLNPFTYTTHEYNFPAIANYQQAIFNFRAANNTYCISLSSSSSAVSGTKIPTPATSNISTNKIPKGVLIDRVNTNRITMTGAGIGTDFGQPVVLLPYFGGGLGDLDFILWNLKTNSSRRILVADYPSINPPAMFPLLPQILEGTGLLGLLNYNPIGQDVTGIPTTDYRSPYVLVFQTDAFTSGRCFLGKLVFDDPTIAAAFNAPNTWNCQTTPAGFLYRSNLQTIPTQRFTFILVSRDMTRYRILRILPQSAAANTCILNNSFTGIRNFIDSDGVFYYKADNDQDRIFNSQGFSFPFQFDTTKLGYTDLPCWPPCYGVPLAKGNKL